MIMHHPFGFIIFAFFISGSLLFLPSCHQGNAGDGREMSGKQALSHYSSRTKAYLKAGKRDSAMVVLEGACAVSIGKSDSVELGNILYWMADIKKDNEQYKMAEKYCLESITVYEKIHRMDFEAGRAYQLYGVLLMWKNNRFKAQQYLLAAYRIFEKIDSLKGLNRVSCNLGSNCYAMGNKSEAFRYYRLGAKLAQKCGDSINYKSTLMNLGVLFRQINPDSALYYYEKAFAVKMAANQNQTDIMITFNISNIYLDKKDYAKAREMFDQVLEKCRAIKNYGGIARSYDGISSMYEGLGNERQSVAYLKQAIDIADSIDDISLQISLMNKLESKYKKAGNYKSALALSERTRFLSDSTQTVDEKASLNEVEMIIQHTSSDAENMQLKTELENQRRMLKYRLIFIFILALAIFAMIMFFSQYHKLSQHRIKAAEREKEIETKFNKIFNKSPALMLLATADKRQITEVNDTFLQKTGFSRDEVIGKTATELNIFSRKDQQLEVVAELQRTGRVDNVEVLLALKGGKLLNGLFSAEIIQMEAGQSLLSVMTDIGDLKQAQEALLQQTKMQKILMDTAAHFINIPIDQVDAAINNSLKEIGEFVQSDRIHIVNFNLQATTLSYNYEWHSGNLPADAGINQEMSLDAFPAELNILKKGNFIYIADVPAMPDGAFKDTLIAGKIKSMINIPLMSGDECLGFFGLNYIESYHNFNDNEVGLLLLFSELLVNVRNWEEAERELRRTNVDLALATATANEMAVKAENANKAKSIFLAGMTHEIRTPLNAIIGFSHLLNRSALVTDKQMEYVDSIIRAGEHLLSLVNDILELSKIEAGHLALNRRNVDLHTLFADIELIFKEQARSKHLQFVFETTGDAPPYILVDDSKLRRIFVNLIGNAIKFTDRGGVAVRTHVEKEPDGKIKLTVEVQDSGMGISEDEQSKLFLNFEQTSAGINKGSGTGLGLALSRELAVLMGGNISVSSELKKGSVFTFYVEMEEGNTEAARNYTENRVVGIASGHKACRVLVVDDNDVNLKVAADLLRLVGFEIKEAVNGKDAIEKFKEWNPQLILMDKCMPVMDGYEASLCIKSTEQGENVPVILVTASSFEDERMNIVSHKIDGYIRKPFRESELFEIIGKTLGITYTFGDEKNPDVYEKYLNNDDGMVEDIAQLHDILVLQMRDAVEVADFDLLIELIGRIDPKHSGLVKRLGTLASNYDYDYLLQILNVKETI